MPLTKPYTFLPHTTGLSAEVNANFDAVIGWINEHLADLSGPSFTGAVMLPASDPTNVNHATRKGYVDAQDTAIAASAAGDATAKVTAAKGLVPKVGGGMDGGVSNGSGDITILHHLPWTPVSVHVVMVDNGSSGPGLVQTLIQHIDSAGFTVRLRSTVNGGVLGGAGLNFYWIAYGGVGV